MKPETRKAVIGRMTLDRFDEMFVEQVVETKPSRIAGRTKNQKQRAEPIRNKKREWND